MVQKILVIFDENNSCKTWCPHTFDSSLPMDFFPTFGLKHQKIPTMQRSWRGWVRLQVPLTSSECALTKNSFLFTKLRRNFLELPLLFLELLFYFPEVPFCLLELSFYIPEVPFYFSRKPYCFPELLSSLPQVPSSYLLSASFSKNAFFLS